MGADIFQREGYWLQPSVFTGDALTALQADLDRISGWTGGVANQTGQHVVRATPWVAAEANRYFTPVRHLRQESVAWQGACDALAPIADVLVQSPLVLDHCMGIIKPPQVGQTFPWHQDGAYYGPASGIGVLANVYLDDTTADNGSIQVVPQTQTHLRAHSMVAGKKSLPDLDVSGAIEPQAKAGDVLWFHLWTVHGSRPNLSAFCRRAVRVGFLAPKCA